MLKIDESKIVAQRLLRKGLYLLRSKSFEESYEVSYEISS
jgi:hypothetical protein